MVSAPEPLARRAMLARLSGVCVGAGIWLAPHAQAQGAKADFVQIPTSPRAQAAIDKVRAQVAQAMEAAGSRLGQPVYLRITKQPAELQVWARAPGRADYVRVGAWPVCAMSGTLGPKLAEGDGQAPEGFYRVGPAQMNPRSNYHLSFNLGFPNAFDRAQGRTGSFLMVHGGCASIGCYAMTDSVIEQVWTMMVAAFEAGQVQVPVHCFPFAMTDEALARHAQDPNIAFWRTLAPAWTRFAERAIPPRVRVVRGRYVVG